MLGQPEPVIAEPVEPAGELEAVREHGGAGAAGRHDSEIQDRLRRPRTNDRRLRHFGISYGAVAEWAEGSPSGHAHAPPASRDGSGSIAL
ncbi:hypothetical protein BpKM376_46700 [Burkholderia pseudomallei]|nr:hypothetical protein GTC054_48090 [Burkholderia pseudomallei]BEH39567.1 hypothetical protein GTC254T_46620 [Burkholderia pseudomallei]BEH57491.1 hypothetical protein BpKM376_46700 [Burkholderia pseudomallei]BEH69636.1 hypothetical protein BpKM391_47110 [Burkholderia pseudomallei]